MRFSDSNYYRKKENFRKFFIIILSSKQETKNYLVSLLENFLSLHLPSSILSLSATSRAKSKWEFPPKILILGIFLCKCIGLFTGSKGSEFDLAFPRRFDWSIIKPTRSSRCFDEMTSSSCEICYRDGRSSTAATNCILMEH